MSQLKIKDGNSWINIPAGGIGVPSGGNQGDVLVKSSSTDYATEWATIPYIIEEDDTTATNTRWHYRKWSNGTVEAWGHFDATVAVTTSSAAYGGYRSSDISFPIPSAVGLINTSYYITAEKTGANSVKIANIMPYSTAEMRFYLFSSESTNTQNLLDAYILGKWK